MVVVLLASASCIHLSGTYIQRTNLTRWRATRLMIFFENFPQDYATYLTHRLYHYPFLYRTFHKMHHKYKQPTAFSVTAIHPVELTHMQLVLASPIVLMPVHWSKCYANGSHDWMHANVNWNDTFVAYQVLFYGILLYTYYHGIIGHSGITFKAQWWQPWQPDAIFHDNHHQYTHVNFGFNIYIWDMVSIVGAYSKINPVSLKKIRYLFNYRISCMELIARRIVSILRRFSTAKEKHWTKYHQKCCNGI